MVKLIDKDVPVCRKCSPRDCRQHFAQNSCPDGRSKQWKDGELELIKKDGKIIKMIIHRDFGGNPIIDNPFEFHFNRVKQSFSNLERSVDFYHYRQKYPKLRLTVLRSRYEGVDPLVQFLNGRKVKITIEVVE